MSPVIEEQLQNIEQSIIIGDHEKGLELIEKNLKRKDITEDDKFRLLNFKGYMLNKQGNYQQAFEIAEGILSGKKEEKYSLIYLDAIILKTVTLFLLNKMTQAQVIMEESLHIINKIPNADQKELSKSKCFFHNIKGSYMWTLGNYEEGKKNLQLAIKYAKESGYTHQEIFCSAQLAMIYIFQEKLSEAEEILEQTLELAQSLNNKHELAFVYNRIGVIKARRFDYEEALNYYIKAESLLKELGSTFIHTLYLNIADLYLSKYQLDESLEYAEKALEFGFMEYIILALIGEIYLWKNEFGKAEETLLKAMKLGIKVSDRSPRVIPQILYNLIVLSVEKKDKEKAEDYLKQFKDLAKEKDSGVPDYYYKLAQIIYYKASSDLDEWGKAKKILNELLKDKKLPDHLRIDALFSLLEIRLMELQITASKETLEQVHQQILELQNEAEEKRLFWVLVELYYLRSQVSLLELNVKKSLELLTTARTMAEDKGLKLLVQKIEKKQENVENQIEMWNKLKEQKAPLAETLKEIELEKTAKEIVKETIMEVRDESTGQIKEYRKLFSIKI